MIKTRVDGRRSDELRRLSIVYDVCEFAAASLLLQMGRTKVLCAITMQQGVPPFLRGKQRGWLTAEYAMLPTATPTRAMRETSTVQRSGRSVEISRLIGRALRSIVKFESLGERTIMVDCDVLQADGSTRTACISGAYLALRIAVNRWLAQGVLTEDVLTDELAAVSIGIVDDTLLLDLTYEEDSRACADFNVIVARSGGLVEIQGTAEQRPVPWQQFYQVCLRAQASIATLFQFFDEQVHYIASRPVVVPPHSPVEL